MRITSRRMRSSLNRPAATSRRRSRFVAATRGRRHGEVFSPTRLTSPSWSVRRSLACARGDSSPTSSRKSVPRCDSSKTPARSATAPVNAPRLWPNSSASTRSSGSAAQFSAENVRSRLTLRRCTALATSSLPEPLSPSTRIGKGAAAARRCFRTSAMPRLLPRSYDSVPAATRRRLRPPRQRLPRRRRHRGSFPRAGLEAPPSSSARRARRAVHRHNESAPHSRSAR